MKYGKQLIEKKRRTDERGRGYTHLRMRTNLKAGNGVFSDGVYTVTFPQSTPDVYTVTIPAP